MTEADNLIEKLQNDIKHLTDVCHSQDLNLKILSNKFNIAIEKLDAISKLLECGVAVKSESVSVIAIDQVPTPTIINTQHIPHPIMNPQDTEVSLGQEEAFTEYEPPKPSAKKIEPVDDVKIPVIQRVLWAKNNKSIFMAAVEIVNKLTNEVIAKTKSSSSGKWQCLIPKGSYVINIKRLEPATNEEVSYSKEFFIDGKQSPLTLPDALLK